MTQESLPQSSEIDASVRFPMYFASTAAMIGGLALASPELESVREQLPSVIFDHAPNALLSAAPGSIAAVGTVVLKRKTEFFDKLTDTAAKLKTLTYATGLAVGAGVNWYSESRFGSTLLEEGRANTIDIIDFLVGTASAVLSARLTTRIDPVNS